MELRTEQRHIRNSYPNDDLAAFALPVGKYESRMCSLVCSELRKFRYVEGIVKKIFIRAYRKPCTLEQWRKFLTWACITISHLCENRDRLQSRHLPMNLQKLILLEAGEGHPFLRKAIANGVQKMGAVKQKMKTTTETQRTQRIAELKRGGEHKFIFLLVFSVFSVPLW